MNKKIYCLTLGMIITLTTTVFGHKEVKHTKKHSTDHSDKVSEQKWTEGIVRRIDSAEEKITIKHGEIKNIGMPPMTMTFQVKDSVLLQDLKIRDEIRFQVTDLGDGEFRVEALEIIKPYSKDNHSQKINSSKSEEIKNVFSQSDIKEKENLINESHKVMEGSSENELKIRRDEFKQNPKMKGNNAKRGYAWLYQNHVMQADEGCDFDFLKSK